MWDSHLVMAVLSSLPLPPPCLQPAVQPRSVATDTASGSATFACELAVGVGHTTPPAEVDGGQFMAGDCEEGECF